MNRILPFAKREGRRLFGNTKWLFQQDGATAHTAQISQKWCERNFHAFLRKENWPPNSPDLNPLDYFFWNEVTQYIRIGSFSNNEEFKEKITEACEKVENEKIKKSIESFTSRVRKVENLKGHYLE